MATEKGVSLFAEDPVVMRLKRELEAFMDEHIYPNEAKYLQHLQDSTTHWQPPPFLEDLKAKAKAKGLWNLFMPKDTDPEGRYGAGLTNLQYAPLAEIMGRVLWASEVFNCSAPDTGNMEVLARYGTEEQKREWLIPLLEGKIRSCFAMTEPDVASSDATNIHSTIQAINGGKEYVINGRKWWTSGALDPRCKLCIFMGRVVSSTGGKPADAHRQHSMIIVPLDAKGITIKRALTVFGYDDAPHGHAELVFDGVVVPRENMLLGEGRGFEIAQGRLGPGRIHHCMRAIGMAERALALLKQRATQRVAFGKPLAGHAAVLHDIAASRIDIDQARLLTLWAAHLMDSLGNRAARKHIAMIKVVAPRVALAVIDRAIQLHGAAGVSQDFPLAYLWVAARTLRIADGPDEVHTMVVARLEMAMAKL